MRDSLFKGVFVFNEEDGQALLTLILQAALVICIMIRPVLFFVLALLFNGCAVYPKLTTDSKARRLLKADALPLSLDDSFEFRKTKTLWLDEVLNPPTIDPMINFERQHYYYGAVTGEERRRRWGHYFDFWWKARRKADLTLRLEYRQEKLGAYVQAQEVKISNAFGGYQTKFNVIGDDYLHEGRVIAWRAVLIEDGKIVALNQSALWY
jgi:hypothetical protein